VKNGLRSGLRPEGRSGSEGRSAAGRGSGGAAGGPADEKRAAEAGEQTQFGATERGHRERDEECGKPALGRIGDEDEDGRGQQERHARREAAVGGETAGGEPEGEPDEKEEEGGGHSAVPFGCICPFGGTGRQCRPVPVCLPRPTGACS
ncbi:MAG: hypothetical protein ACK56I_35915, partial [bacterium]